MSRRTLRVEDTLRSEISELILHRLGDPRVRLTTVSAVDVSPDLRRAVVRISVLGGERERQESLGALRMRLGMR